MHAQIQKALYVHCYLTIRYWHLNCIWITIIKQLFESCERFYNKIYDHLALTLQCSSPCSAFYNTWH